LIDFGTVRPGTTLYVPFATYAGSTGASVTLTGLAVTDIEIYKNGSVTQRSSDTGYTLLDTDGIDFDGVTGIHGFSIDLSSNADAGFFVAGADYFVVVSSVTVDSQTVTFLAARFRIGYEDALINTTIATLASQTSFTLTAGPAEDDALNGCVVLIHDIASAVQLGWATILDYTGSTKTVTLVAGTTFTAAAGDNISVFMPRLLPTVAGRTLDIQATGEADANVTLANGAAVEVLDNVYHADIQFTRDQANTQDEWTVTWFKNGVRQTSGITSPTLQAIKRADGTDLFAATAMTQIGSTGSYKLDRTTTNRITVGEAVVAVAVATIDAASREFSRLIGRDSS
jgi:hypothetical protein